MTKQIQNLNNQTFCNDSHWILFIGYWNLIGVCFLVIGDYLYLVSWGLGI